MPSWILRLESIAAACLFRMLRRSLRFSVTGQPADDFRCVYAFWHRDLLILSIQRMFSGAVVLVSASRDGQLIAGPLAKLGYRLVRGSSTRGGSQALKELVRLGRNHSLAITPDGPKGPAGTIHPGIFQVALLASVPIIPVRVSCDRVWLFKTWDRLRLPRPFARIRIEYGEHIAVRNREEFPAAEATLRAQLNNPMA